MRRTLIRERGKHEKGKRFERDTTIRSKNPTGGEKDKGRIK